MKRFLILVSAFLMLSLVGCDNIFKGNPTDPIAGQDVQYSGTVSKDGGADYSKWTYRILYPGHANAYYPKETAHLSNTGAFSVMTPYGPEELHQFQVFAVGDILVVDQQNPHWEKVAEHQYTFNFIMP